MENVDDAKRKIETTKQSMRSIAAEHGTNHVSLKNFAEKHGWYMSHRVSKKVSKPQNPHNKILGNVALRKIEELKKELGDKYSPIDEPLIVMYAKSYERYIELEQELSVRGVISISSKTGAEYLSPTFTASLAIQKNLVTIANQLGLSLASRKKLNINFQKLDEKQSSIFDFAGEINDNSEENSASNKSTDSNSKMLGFDIDDI